MQYVTLNNGIKMPVLGFGTWDLRGQSCIDCVLQAVKCGYRLIDTAQMYGNEQAVGNALRLSDVSRSEFFVTTKICAPNNSYTGARQAIEQSLEKLGLDYIDLMLVHEPYLQAGEMYQAMEEAYAAGKLQALGVSNFNTEVYTDLVRQCRVVPAVNQVEAHVFYQQKILQKTIAEYNTVLEAWSPLAAGKKQIFAHPILHAIGQKHAKSLAQTALRFLLQSGMVVIPKSAHKEHMRENIALFDFELTSDDMQAIRALDTGKTLFGWY